MSRAMLRIGQKALASSGRQPFVVDAGEPVGVDVALDDLNVMGVVRQHHHAARRIHHVVVQLLRQALPQLQRVLVEGGRFLPQIVGAHDRRVAAGVAAPEPALLEHGDLRQPVLLGQVIGGREPMPARPDDDRVISSFRLGTAPLLRPALILRERLPRHIEKRKPHWTRPPLNRLIEGGRLPCPARDCEHNFAGLREVFRIWRDALDRDGAARGRARATPRSTATIRTRRQQDRRVLVG